MKLSPQLFAILSALVEERLGLHHGPGEAELFGDKIATRAAEAGFESLLDYYYFLRYDASAAGELDALADALVVGETYFFRELDALRAGVEQVVVPAVTKRGKARIWSVACATGEEPLSIAMLLAEAGIARRCEIIATDVSARALAKAREGVYGTRSLRALSPNPPPRGFTEQTAAIASAAIVRDGSKARVVKPLIDTINYRQLNLLDDAAIAAMGSFDLVLCRNVLIYFDRSLKERTLKLFHDSLSPLGFMCLGRRESLRFTDVEGEFEELDAKERVLRRVR